MKRILCAMLLLGLVPLAQPAAPVRAGAPPDFAALDAAIAAQMTKHGLPGVALAVVEADAIVYRQGYGTAGARAMTSQTPMFIGSQSKSFTALAVAQLVEQGRLNLTDPVQTHIPWFTIADPEAAGQITVNHFLRHTSGLSESGYSVILPSNAPPEQAVRSLAQARLTAPVGTTFQYFNLGYDVLAYLVELISGQSYSDYVQTHIFEPLGLTRTTADPAAADPAQGYTRFFGWAVPMTQPVRDYEIGAGYIVSTADDLARYAIALLNEGAGLLTPEMTRQMFTPGLGDYGLGWHITPDRAKIYHGGANETFGTHVNLYPKRDRAFVLLINEGHLIDHYVSSQQLMQTVEAWVLGRPLPPVAQGWTTRWIGWGMGGVCLALLSLHLINFYGLFRNWKDRARRMSPAKKVLAVAMSFILPTLILVVVFSQLKGFFGYRFNLLTNLEIIRYFLPDAWVLMVVGSVPDYAQGFIKLWWLWRGEARTISPRVAAPLHVPTP